MIQSNPKYLLELLYSHGMIKTSFRDRPEGWTLHSGIVSPLYIQLRDLPSHPHILKLLARQMAPMVIDIQQNSTKRIVLLGLAMTGIALATAISLETNIPMAFTRKQVDTNYGDHHLIEGILHDHDRLILIDDLITSFKTGIKAIESIRLACKQKSLKNIVVKDGLYVVDREQGGKQEANKAGISTQCLIPLQSNIDALSKHLAPKEMSILRNYFQDPEAFSLR